MKKKKQKNSDTLHIHTLQTHLHIRLTSHVSKFSFTSSNLEQRQTKQMFNHLKWENSLSKIIIA